jgi:hypothetical protein
VKEDELESAFLALLIYMRGTARYGSTYGLSTVSGRRLLWNVGWLSENVGRWLADVDNE